MSDPAASSPPAGDRPPAADGVERFVLLDGLRGVAAFAVILDHVPGGWLGDLLPGRYLAVDFFFVLSGFVLAHAYGERLEQGWSPLAFIKARLIRLYPMYLLGLAIALSLAVLGALRGWVGPGWTDILTVAVFSLFFLPTPPVTGYGQGELYPANGPAWSLFFELVANAVYALVARHLGWRVLGGILVVGAVAVVFTLNRHAGTGGPGWLWAHVDAGLARVAFDFFAGVAIYRLRRNLRVWAMPWWAAVFAFLALIAVPTPPAWRVAYDIAAALVLMPMMVAFACGASVSGVVARVCAISGLLSYGVYVLHVPLYAAVSVGAAVLGLNMGAGPLLAVIVALLAAVVSGAAHVMFDAPVRRWLSARAKAAERRATAGEGG